MRALDHFDAHSFQTVGQSQEVLTVIAAIQLIDVRPQLLARAKAEVGQGETLLSYACFCLPLPLR